MTQNDDTNDTISCSVSKVRQENAVLFNTGSKRTLIRPLDVK